MDACRRSAVTARAGRLGGPEGRRLETGDVGGNAVQMADVTSWTSTCLREHNHPSL